MASSDPAMTTSLLEARDEWLAAYRPKPRFQEQGRVVSVGDGIAWISGLPSAAMEDVLLFDDGSRAMVFDLNEAMIGAILLQETEALTAGTGVQCTGRTLEVPVGDALLGRVIDPLGNPLDGLGPIATSETRPVETEAPGVAGRQPVCEALQTGIKAVDAMTPVGRGRSPRLEQQRRRRRGACLVGGELGPRPDGRGR